MTQYSQYAEENDGWLLALMGFGCSEFGWPIQYVLDEISVLSMLLLLRQRSNNEGKTVMSLADKEKIDRLDWAKAVEENHKKLIEGMKRGQGENGN